jgi:hypothetical protein
MTEPDDSPGAPRRRSKEKRVPLSLRITPRMRERLGSVAFINGRSVTQQTELLLDHALFREVEDLPAIMPAASTNDLWNRLLGLEAAFRNERAAVTGLRAAVEKGLDHNAEVIARVEALLLRRVAEIEAKAASDTGELATAVSRLETLSAHLLAALQKIDRSRTGDDARSHPRLVSDVG